MGIGHAGHVLVLLSKAGELCQHTDQLFADEFQACLLYTSTLDDSANKRVAMAEGFLAADAILNIMRNVTDGILVYPKVVRSRRIAELPFMAREYKRAQKQTPLSAPVLLPQNLNTSYIVPLK